MSDKTWPKSIRYTLKEQPSPDLPFEAYWDIHGFVLGDGGGGVEVGRLHPRG